MLTQAVGYAAVALGYISLRQDGVALVRTIAKDCGMPAPYLSKIINQLARSDLVTTQRGVGGGVRLGRAAEDITLYDLCEALNDPAIEERCMLGIADCSDERGCAVHAFGTEMRGRLLGFLRSMTVAEIGAAERDRRGWDGTSTGVPAGVEAAG
ncbi:MAG: Rrf2 family transcriptional regulator [Phycisphaerales bacterium]|nr:Rrf2 family transcriptional regulator [Planctomycetota bacterium]MCH8508478.1 Rrf2 family transcriptional regulator [Phycisphaerales bacterium]